MRRFILTGAPGAGKTTLLRCLEQMGYLVVEEAATDVIAREQERGVSEPWTDPVFIEQILELQKQRQDQEASSTSTFQVFDRSPLDTLALCRYLEYPIGPALLEEIKQAQAAGNYERDVFFIDNLGSCAQTAARRISFEDSLRFETLHAEIYAEWSYQCVRVPRKSVDERVQMIQMHLLG